MCALLRSVRAATGVTTLHITHNVSEADLLADRLFFLRDGRVEEGRPAARPVPSVNGIVAARPVREVP
jgi:ABC-type sulfate/molybdate transport systems ATPase subunit